MSSMLEQALVDATALKEAALKKAEAAVLDAAKPKIEETLKALLEADGDELEDLLGDPGGDEVSLNGDLGPGEIAGAADNLTMGITAGEKMCACPDEEEEIEIDFGELERQMVADEQSDALGTEMGQDDLAAELNLSSPGEELGAEMTSNEDEFDIDEEYLAEEIASALKEKEHCDDEDAPVEEAKMSKDMVAAASADAHRDYKRQQSAATPEKESPRHKSLGQEFDLDTGDDDAPLELAEGEMIITKEKLMEIVNSHTKDLFTSQTKKDKEIEKLKSYLVKLTEQVKETNLSNARLLYTNQTLESVSLNERQKTKIVEAVSKAGSVEEARVIYETLIVSVGSTINDRKKPKSLREAVERRSTPLIARGNKPEKVSNDPVRARMRELAGIKK